MQTSDAREHFESNGWLVFDPGISMSLIDQARSDQEALLHNVRNNDRDRTTPGRVQDAWKTSPAARAIATAPGVHQLLREIYGREALPFQTLSFDVGTEQAIHSDTIHFNSVPARFMCGVWVALEDIDLDNGPLVYYSGSQRLPEWTMRDVDEEIPPATDVPIWRKLLGPWWLRRLPRIRHRYLDEIGRERYPRYEQFVRKRISELDIQPSYGVVAKGQAIVWASNLLHGGAARRDPARSRHSQVTHYYFKECRYYTPLLSDTSGTMWREPEWITP